MERPLVVGVDGSEGSLRAVDWAVDEALRLGLPLRLVYGSLWERYEGSLPSLGDDQSAEGAAAEGIVASCVARARQRGGTGGVQVSGDVLPDDAVSVLLHVAHTSTALVTGSRGRGGVAGLLLGSVSLAVAARAACPVIVVRGEERNRQGACDRVVVGVGGGAQSTAAIRYALREARARDCALFAVRAWRRPAHKHMDSPLAVDDSAIAQEDRASAVLTDALRDAAREYSQVDVVRRVREGPAHKVLLDMATDADLVVVGAVRREGHLGLQLGRVAHVLLHHARCPVAVIPERV
ncbi:universal stress protein [Streptomyces buecherae]|uniref:universal stress protein n=1 Tax=Streptomyces buecherae TaxID=2763006 RepID=UPI0037892454